MLDKNELLFFIHIPKTAGYTLGRNILPAEYPGKLLYLSDRPNQLSRLKETLLKRNNYQVFATHQYYREIVDLITNLKINKKISYITMLRHPVDRLISAYFFKKKVAAVKHPDSPILKYSIIDYMKSDERDPLVDTDNLQTKYLSGSDRLDIANLDLAKENLKHKFKAFGITKRFEDSCFLMKQALGWSGNVDYKQKQNASRRPRIIDQRVMNQVITIIEAKNQSDIMLYNYAVELFNQRFNALPLCFKTPHRLHRYSRLRTSLSKNQKYSQLILNRFNKLNSKSTLLKEDMQNIAIGRLDLEISVIEIRNRIRTDLRQSKQQRSKRSSSPSVPIHHL